MKDGVTSDGVASVVLIIAMIPMFLIGAREHPHHVKIIVEKHLRASPCQARTWHWREAGCRVI